MFVDNQVLKKFKDEEKNNKFAIESTLLDVFFKGSVCKQLVQEYTQKTTVMSNSFSF